MNIIYIDDYKQFSRLKDSVHKGQIKYHQFYNIDFDVPEYNYIQYMSNFKPLNESRYLNKTYYDIEIFVNGEEFPDPSEAKFMVNSIATYNNHSNSANLFCIIKGTNIEDPDVLYDNILKNYIIKSKEHPSYNVQDIQINLNVYENEEDLFLGFFGYLRESGTSIVIGFNSSSFDDVYMMNRGAKLFGKDSFENIVSEFGELNIRTKDGVNFFSTPDYLFSDLLKLYQPVDKGGRGLGQSLPSYKLDAVAFEELGVTKLEMADGYLKGYLYNISTYLLYNLFDVLLTYKLDLKLQFYDFLFEMALYNNATMGSIIMGTSKMYSYRNDLDNYRKGVLVRTKRFNSETLSSDYEPKN